jgi:hypothetical protein
MSSCPQAQGLQARPGKVSDEASTPKTTRPKNFDQLFATSEAVGLDPLQRAKRRLISCRLAVLFQLRQFYCTTDPWAVKNIDWEVKVTK